MFHVSYNVTLFVSRFSGTLSAYVFSPRPLLRSSSFADASPLYIIFSFRRSRVAPSFVVSHSSGCVGTTPNCQHRFTFHSYKCAPPRFFSVIPSSDRRHFWRHFSRDSSCAASSASARGRRYRSPATDDTFGRRTGNPITESPCGFASAVRDSCIARLAAAGRRRLLGRHSSARLGVAIVANGDR